MSLQKLYTNWLVDVGLELEGQEINLCSNKKQFLVGFAKQFDNCFKTILNT